MPEDQTRNLRTEWQKAYSACARGGTYAGQARGRFPWYKYEGSSVTTSAGLPPETS